MDLLRDHGLGFGDQVGIVPASDLEKDPDGRFGIFSPVNLETIPRDSIDETAEVFIQVVDDLSLDGVGTPAAILEIRDGRKGCKTTNGPALSIPIQGNLQVFIRQGLADAGAEISDAHRLFNTSAM
jgi:hypothetical protein